MALKTDPNDSFDSLAAEQEHTANRYFRFWVLVIGIVFFFGCHNYMQELIMSLPGFRVNALLLLYCSMLLSFYNYSFCQVGSFLGYLEVLGVAICSFFERKYYGETVRRASWNSYFMLCLFLLISSATSNISLAYINYPTKVVFRSCKLIPTMIIAVCYNNKTVHWYEFLFGTLISCGMVLFAVADFTVSPNFNFLGKCAPLPVCSMYRFH